MRFEPAKLFGVVRVAPTVHSDERGTFARLFDRAAFAGRGLETEFPEHSYATNARRGVLRGLHYQVPPFGEVKIIRCARGRVFDVLLDIRVDSPTYGEWEAFEVSSDDLTALYVPAGIAHGYQSLTDDAQMHYMISTAYVAESSKGYRFDSPQLAIPWPVKDVLISDRDRTHPVFERQ